MKKGFTLAEILIVLVIMGVLTMILLPVAFQSSPDEKVMKFKKGYNTLNTVIRELVSSDRYYQNGDLGTRANGNTIDGEHDGDITYFCETFAAPGAVPIYSDKNGFDAQYKLFCMDIDGIGEGEDPFAFGIRADGKVLVGYKAKEWLKKPINN